MVYYFKAERTNHSQNTQNQSVGLSDQSGLGHLLALEQMSMPIGNFTGCVLFNEGQHLNFFQEFFDSCLQPIKRHDEVGNESLMQWVIAQNFHPDRTVFYIVGNNRMVSKLRRSLKACGFSSSQIKIKRFLGLI